MNSQNAAPALAARAGLQACQFQRNPALLLGLHNTALQVCLFPGSLCTSWMGACSPAHWLLG